MILDEYLKTTLDIIFSKYVDLFNGMYLIAGRLVKNVSILNNKGDK